MQREKIALIFALFFITLFTSCSVDKKEMEDINAILDIRSLAINKADSKGYNMIVSSQHPDREKVIENFRLYQKHFKNMNHEVHKRNVESYSKMDNIIKIEQTYSFSYTPPTGKVKKLDHKKEIITLKKFENGWRIIDGLK